MTAHRRLALVVGVGLLLIGVVGMVSVGWLWLGPRSQRDIAAEQVAYLASLTPADGAAMQQYFPEGEFFTASLTGLAAANLARSSTDSLERARYLDITELMLARIDRPAVADRFGDVPELEHGVFYRGWRLLLLADLVTIDDGTDRSNRFRARASQEAAEIATAIGNSPTGFLPGYPGQFWPCDTVVAVAALGRLAQQPGSEQVPGWLDRVRQWQDPATGLLPHQVRPDGTMIDGTQGTSQSIIAAFWPEVTTGDAVWERFRTQFVTRELGLVGVREYPRGTDGAANVDSGPLVFGVSLSASAVSLAAANRVGDATLSSALDREADLTMPWVFDGQRRYAWGQLPVGDAFVAWARSVPQPAQALPTSGPYPLWPLAGLAWLVPIALGVALVRGPRHRNGAAPARLPASQTAAD